MTMTNNKRPNVYHAVGSAGCPDWDDFDLDCYDIKPAESYEVENGESGGDLLMFDPNE